MRTSTSMLKAPLACAVVSAVMFGCGSSDTRAAAGAAPDSGADAGDRAGLAAAAAQELRDKNVDRYIGKSVPSSHEQNGDTTLYKFDSANDGPICLKGGDFQAIVRDQHSEDLVVYLEGGGACWTGFCLANETASTFISGPLMPPLMMLDNADPNNAVRGWNEMYVPYCDGSVFSGDNDVAQPDGTTIHHRGLRNLTAAVDLAKSLFPNVKRLLLAGTSAGGYGTIVGTSLVLLAWPGVGLTVFNDAGVGLLPPDPTTQATVEADWKWRQFVPDSCTDCNKGQQTSLIAWALKNEPSLRVSAFSSYGDSTIGGVFLKMQAADFKALLLKETGKVHDAHPDRFQRFFVEGTTHTLVLSGYATTTVDGETGQAFVNAMVNGTTDWKDYLENGGI